MATSRVHRTKPQFERIVTPFRDASLILIASEGEKTEASYFSFPFLLHRRVKILPIPSNNGKSSPSHVLDNLKKEAKKYNLTKGDRLWLVIDRDRWRPYQISEVMGKRVCRLNIRVAISNPCFELWLYLHFAKLPSDPVSNSKMMVKLLRKIKGSYQKHTLISEDYEQGIARAMEEAAKTIIDTDGIPINPGTQVFLILRDIQELRIIDRTQSC